MKRKKQKTKQTRAKSTAKQTTANRTYKARLFEMVFSEKKELLELYNAMNGTDYKDPELLQINTLENAIYMSMRNDLSFIIDSRLNLYEHQSTYSPNLPLRCFMYVADLYSEITADDNLYGKSRVIIPTPRFVIFYNGIEERPDKELLKLSDLFSVYDENVDLELKAVMVNINPGHNEGLLATCKTLGDYSEYTYRVRKYAKEMRLEDAVERAITECIAKDILAEFLRKYRAEAKKVSIYEYDEEKHMRQTREEGYEEGIEAGKNVGIAQEQENGIRILIETYMEFGVGKEIIADKVRSKYSISEEKATEYLEKYWREK